MDYKTCLIPAIIKEVNYLFKYMKKLFFTLGILLILPFNSQAASYTYDLGINASDISFSHELVAGQTVRIYAGVHNYGSQDVSGYVTFYQSNSLIGDSQTISVKAGGLTDEVYVDFTVPNTSFNIRAEINGQNPGDENPANDVALTTLFNVLPDTDGDGIPDTNDTDDDNDGIQDQNEPILGTDPVDADTDDDGCLDGADDFPLNPNECIDTDGDGIGNNQDTDDDNDGLSDNRENQIGTDPLNPDTDGDGVIDSQDYCPGDPNCTQKPPEPGSQSQDDNSEDEVAAEEGNQTEDNNDNENNQNINPSDSEEQLSPSVLIKSEPKDWNTFIFSPELRGVIDENLVYQWDFGDGTQANQKIVEHTFSQAGEYNVALKITGKDNLTLINTKKIEISFFNLANNTLKILIAGLIILLGVLSRLTFCGARLRR